MEVLSSLRVEILDTRHCFDHPLRVKWTTPRLVTRLYVYYESVESWVPYVFHSAITTRIDEEREARTYRHGQRMVPALPAATVHARPLSRERSKSKPTSQPIVNTGTTGEFNSIRTRSSDCSIVRHRIPSTRSCGLFPLYLSLPPFSTLACNPQCSSLTLSWFPFPYAL